LVPGASPVLEIKTPVAALGNSQEPLQHVQLVQALVDEDAAALAFPGGPPSAAGVVSLGAEPFGDDPGETDDPAQLAAVNQFFDLGVAGFGAHLEHGAEDLPGMLPPDGDQPLGVGFVGGNRFFDHDVQPGLERGDAQGGVLVMRRGDEDGIHFARTDQFPSVVENLQTALLVGDKFVRKRVGHGLQLAPFDFAGQEVFRVVAPDVAHADNAETN
jgi:hypothetical protein